LFLLRIGYDETFKNCSPGNLLRVESIRYATERGLRSYEFLGSDAAWTYTWTKTVRPMVSLEAYPASVRGLWVLAQDKLGVPKSMRKKLDKWTLKVGRQRRGI
jgi:CelD/BcsL family acetyltransferase involved in cellulose biosynthesis